ncbi:MAG: bifunctional phosphoribosylaminoimidazolecarboxamide formyltransferase/IMP cyclohydrolase [Scrofimicrobium sp.]
MRRLIDLVVVCAEEEEAEPFLKATQWTGGGSQPRPVELLPPTYNGPAHFKIGYWQGCSTLFVVSGIGTTNAATAITAVLQKYEPKAVIVAGTTGGLGEQILTGDLVLSERVLYHEANATDFGYSAGQVPQMPEDYQADLALLDLAQNAAEKLGRRNWSGTVGSSNSFVTAALAVGLRATFPNLLAVDMETAAVAQACWMFGVPWISLRAVSDLCSPEGAGEYDTHAPEAAQTSFRLVEALAAQLGSVKEPKDDEAEGSAEVAPPSYYPRSSDAERKPIRRALISVWNKTGLTDLATVLVEEGVELVGTSSTAAAIAKVGLPVTEVSELTGFPEILGGRVKTLHPTIHSALLARQNDAESMKTLDDLGIAPFDLVVANLYPFADTLSRAHSIESDLTFADCIEMIDIGGPTMVRAAAKNNESVAIATDPAQYDAIIEALRAGGTTQEERLDLATAAFQTIADYDISIANWLSDHKVGGGSYWDEYTKRVFADGMAPDLPEDDRGFPEWYGASYRKGEELRYGENSHQGAALYRPVDDSPEGGGGLGITGAEQLGGKPLSFNNLQDASAAEKAANSFVDGPAVAIIKHANPCGIAEGATIAETYAKALACDPLSAFGGVVAANEEVDEATAEQIARVFTEVVIAPGYSDEALAILRQKKNLRILVSFAPWGERFEKRHISGGGLLIQQPDKPGAAEDKADAWKLVAGDPASEEQLKDLGVAWKAAQYTKSNAIVLVKDGATVGVGMGQVNRLDSARLAVERANTLADGVNRAKGSVAASDAFFPFPDGLQVLIDAGVTAVVAPGGSIRDQLSIDAANEAGISLYFADRRHFWH